MPGPRRSRWRHGKKQIHFEGEYQAIEAPNRLEFSWRHVQEFADGRHEATDSSMVSVTFTQAGKATEVKLLHEAIKTEDARRGVCGGWDGCFGHPGGACCRLRQEGMRAHLKK